MTTSLADDLVQAGMRLAANYPALAFTPGGPSYGFAESILSGVNDGKLQVDQAAPNLSIQTAQGIALDALGKNYGKDRFLGSGAGVPVQFSVPTPTTLTLTIDAGTAVSTAGDVNTAAIGFITGTPTTITTGQTLAGATIFPPVDEAGTTVANAISASLSTTQPGVVTATYRVFANGTNSFELLLVTSTGTGLIANCATDTVYDDTGHIPGVSFSVASPLHPQDYASFSTGGTPVMATQNSPVDPISNAIYGAQGNVAANTVTVITTLLLSGLQVTNPYAVDGTNGTIPGNDPWGDAQYRQNLLALLYPKYSTSQGEAAILSVPTVFDVAITDPADGTGQITVRWCDGNGTQSGLTYPGGTPTIAAGSTADLVDQALRAVLVPGVTPIYAPFTVINLTSNGAIAFTYSADPAVQSLTIEPQMQAVIVQYMQSLTHGQTPTNYGMIQALGTAGITLKNFTLTTTFAAAGDSTIYRATGDPSVIVDPTRL